MQWHLMRWPGSNVKAYSENHKVILEKILVNTQGESHQNWIKLRYLYSPSTLTLRQTVSRTEGENACSLDHPPPFLIYIYIYNSFIHQPHAVEFVKWVYNMAPLKVKNLAMCNREWFLCCTRYLYFAES